MEKSFNVLNELLVELFNDIMQIEQNSLKQGKLNDLSVTEIHTIEAIGMYEPRSMSEVAADLRITVGTLTTAINKLIKKGYVERQRIEEDRRVVLVRLTKSGKLAYRLHEKFHKDMIKATIEGLSEDEEQILISALERLNNFKSKYNLKKAVRRSEMNKVYISGTGKHVPENIVTNDDLARIVDTSDEWITTRTGIKERRISSGENTSHMATEAAKQALENAGITAEDIDCIIVATITPDMFTPSTACLVQSNLGATKAAAFDLNAACTGFIYALNVATHLIKSGPYNHILVIGSETLSKIVNWEDRNTCVLFGDGAGAVVLSSSTEKE